MKKKMLALLHGESPQKRAAEMSRRTQGTEPWSPDWPDAPDALHKTAAPDRAQDTQLWSPSRSGGDTLVWPSNTAASAGQPSAFVLKVYLPTGIHSHSFSVADAPFRLGSAAECECRVASPALRGQVRIEPARACLTVEQAGVATAEKMLDIGDSLPLGAGPCFFLGGVQVVCESKLVRK